ncbi:hypothetical protein vseg_010193 [Gypsophila vaccaria]
MGADGGVPANASRGNVLSSSDIPMLSQYLSLEPISLGAQKFMRSGELRRALGFSLANASEDHMFRVSNFKPSAPLSTEDLKLYKENVFNASVKARERSKFFRNSIYKLDRYTEAVGSKKRQRSDSLLNEKPAGSNSLKITGQPSRHPFDQSAQRLEDTANCSGMNKRFRSTAAELKVDGRLGSLSRDQMNNAKDTKSVVGEGWDQKRKRSNGTVASRTTDNDMKKTMPTKLNTNTKLSSCDISSVSKLSSRSNAKQDTSNGSPGTVTKGKISRAPRTSSRMTVNSSDGQASSESCEGWEQPSSTNKVISLGLMQNNHHAANSSHMPRQWGGQRQQKASRSRRTNVVSPVPNHDEGQILSRKSKSPAIVARSPLNGNSGSSDIADVHNANSSPCNKLNAENTPSPGRLSEIEEILGFEQGVEGKGKDISDVALKGKGKVGAFVIPTKRNKNLLSENDGDGIRRQGRTVRGLFVPDVPQSNSKLENMSTAKRMQNTRHGSEKIKSKSGRPPSKKMSDGRVTRNLESDDDHEELLAAATSARKASCLSCSGRLWKKIEPVFCSVSSQDINHLKQQLSFAEELENCQTLVSCAENNFVKERADAPLGRKGSDTAVDKNEPGHLGLTGEKNMDNLTSLYQRVLCALIEEDENEGFCNGYEGANLSSQWGSDDSHCGSCNYADTETRDRDRFESEAESVVDFQIPKRYPGDRFSCNKSVTSNTTLNTSMSDSLYSSGRWLGDDGLSYSDAEFIGGSYQNDLVGPQGVSASVAYFDGQYDLMCVDDKLMMELQSIGLYPDAMPDLAEEVINQDISDLMEGLYDQIGKKKVKLIKIDSAVHDDSQRDKRFMEEVAMEQLVQMAYKRRMAYRRNSVSKTVIRKVSKQAATGFIERTLARCKAFEVTGQSCFSGPAFQNVLFAAPRGTNAAINIGNEAAKHHNTSKADSVPISMPDSCVEDFTGGCIDSAQAACHSSDNCYPRLESAPERIKKRDLPLNDVSGVSYGRFPTRGAKGKAGESNRDNSKGSLMTDAVLEGMSAAGFKSDGKLKAKTKQKASATPLSCSIQQQVPGNKGDTEMLPSSCNDSKGISENCEEPIDFDSIAQNDTTAPVDLNDWFKDLPDGDFGGCLDIPMDDLSMVL